MSQDVGKIQNQALVFVKTPNYQWIGFNLCGTLTFS
jgi:hypothetical protein